MPKPLLVLLVPHPVARTLAVRTRLAGLTLAALVATAGAVRAQVPSGTEFRVNTYTTGTQRFGSIAGSQGYLFVVTWESAGQDGSHTACSRSDTREA